MLIAFMLINKKVYMVCYEIPLAFEINSSEFKISL